MPGGSFGAPTDQIELPGVASDGVHDAMDVLLERRNLLEVDRAAAGGGFGQINLLLHNLKMPLKRDDF